MKRTIAILLATMIIILPGCGRDKKEKVAYRPIAYGENNQCYYVHDPAEVIGLQDAGLCDRSWAPTVAPVHWQQMYYPYYSSPAYYGTYVPVQTRTVYIERARTWGEQNKAAIKTEAKKATYLGSNGKQVTADKIGAAKYGGGARFGPQGVKFGGGSGRATSPGSNTSPTPAPTVSQTKDAPTPKATSKPPAPSPKPKPSGSKSGGSGGVKSGGGGGKSFGGGGGRPSGGGYSGGGKR